MMMAASIILTWVPMIYAIYLFVVMVADVLYHKFDKFYLRFITILILMVVFAFIQRLPFYYYGYGDY